MKHNPAAVSPMGGLTEHLFWADMETASTVV